MLTVDDKKMLLALCRVGLAAAGRDSALEAIAQAVNAMRKLEALPEAEAHSG